MYIVSVDVDSLEETHDILIWDDAELQKLIDKISLNEDLRLTHLHEVWMHVGLEDFEHFLDHVDSDDEEIPK